MKKYAFIVLGIFLSVLTGCGLIEYVEGTYNRSETGEFEGTKWKKDGEQIWLEFTKTEVIITGILIIKSYYYDSRGWCSGTYRAWYYEEKIKIYDDDGRNIEIATVSNGALVGFTRVW
jgi:hypothetical protein